MKIELTFNITQHDAIAMGEDEYGDFSIVVRPSKLSAKQRATLTALLTVANGKPIRKGMAVKGAIFPVAPRPSMTEEDVSAILDTLGKVIEAEQAEAIARQAERR